MAPTKRLPIERFREKTRVTPSGCVEWMAYRGGNGYGRFYFEGRGALAHRWSYEYHVGPIPEDLVIDHLCRNHACVNPRHLEPVTTRENAIRGELHNRFQASKTHCPRGHEYDESNTIHGQHGRTCRECKKAAAHEYYERNRDLVIERSRLSRLKKAA